MTIRCQGNIKVAIRCCSNILTDKKMTIRCDKNDNKMSK